MDAYKTARTARRMTEARAVLIRENPFFGRLALGLQPACAPCGTACTDGTRVIFDPEFAEKLTEEGMLFVLLHEVLHCALEHCMRGKGLDQFVYNIACDIVVNSMIMEMWGVDSFELAGEEMMHLTPDGREGRLFSSEEVYYMLLENQREEPDARARYETAPSCDRHDIWQTIEDTGQLKDMWNGNIQQAAKACGNASGMPPSLRKVEEDLLHRSRLNWRQLLHDFLQQGSFDYTFLPPDRRFSGSEFFLPSYEPDETGGNARDIWVCVDTSGSVEDDELAQILAEIADAMRQAGLSGMLSFFDTEISEPVPFETREEFRKITPQGGGGTDFHCIFKYLKEHLLSELPRAILICTDGCAPWPREKEALGVPVLWLLTWEGRADPPWGTAVRM